MQSKSFMDENNKLKMENDSLLLQTNSFDAKLEALNKSKQTEI